MTARTDTYFLSDLHLGARYAGDIHAAERRVCRFLDAISPTARRIFLVGDVLDYWYEYRYVVPRGFVRFFGKLAELSDSGVEITWLIGNHDIWIFDYLPGELGIAVVDGDLVTEIDGRKFFISHGDAQDDSSRSFRLMRRLFRNRFCQRLYAAIHPRWTIPFALGWSRRSRAADSQDSAPKPDRLVAFARSYLRDHPDIPYFIFGHLHILEDIHVPPSSRVIILGDWLTRFSYARYDGHSLSLHTYHDSDDDRAYFKYLK